MKLAGPLLVVVLSAGLSGCWIFKKKAPQQPLPPLQAPVLAPPVGEPKAQLPPEDIVLPAPPATKPEQEPIVLKPEPQPTVQQKPNPASNKSNTAKKQGQAPAPVQTPSPPAPTSATTPAQADPPAPVPQLGELISDQRRVEMMSEISQNLTRAREALTHAGQRPLSRSQADSAERIRTFIRQAEDAIARNISTAQQLSRRADLLAQDLIASLK